MGHSILFIPSTLYTENVLSCPSLSGLLALQKATYLTMCRHLTTTNRTNFRSTSAPTNYFRFTAYSPTHSSRKYAQLSAAVCRPATRTGGSVHIARFYLISSDFISSDASGGECAEKRPSAILSHVVAATANKVANAKPIEPVEIGH